MTIPPYFLRKEQHKIGKAGRASENRLAKSLGGRLTPASGAMAGAKGDINLGEALIEAKSTVNESISIKREWLAKIAAEARAVGKKPALSVSFIHGNGSPVKDGQWVMMPLSLWLRMQAEFDDIHKDD